ncbi:MAG: phosphate acyltransferase PlsX [Firmicutes bacterium]|nr:phosphate acyltransferase PlsX [Bacillota bacterium]
MKIAVDAMGGDNAPGAIIEGCVSALSEMDAEILLVGKEPVVRAELEKYKGMYDEDRIQIVHAEEVIENEDSPVKAVRTKKDSSLVMAVDMVKDGTANAMMSAGNTGALMTAALLRLGRIKGIERPAIVSAFPKLGKKGEFVLLADTGANAECTAKNLLSFAYMGSIYRHHAFGTEDPKIGLINIGAEETKGTPMLKEAYQMLKASDLNFIGNVEGREIPRTEADVLVCDGFTGNIVLKLTEGTAWNVFKAIKEKITEGVKAKMGALLLKKKLYSLKEEFDYSSYGGAPILGVKGMVFKMHGSSSAIAVQNAIVKAATVCKRDVIGEIESSMERYRENVSE